MKTSVIIVSYNRPDSCRRTVEAVVNQSRKADEIIVIDNGSDRDYAKGLAPFFRMAAVVYKRIEKSSIPAGRNSGVVAAQGDIVIFIDDDCIPHEAWLENLVKPFERDEEIVVVGGRMASYRRGSFIDEFCEEEFRLYGERLKNPSHSQNLFNAFLPYFITANSAFRKKTLQEIGLFDESFGGSEDVDISFRMRQRGCKVAYEETALVFHDNRPTIGTFLKQYFYYGYYDVALYLKHCEIKRKLRIEFATMDLEGNFSLIKKIFVLEFPFFFPCYIKTINICLRILILWAAFFCLLLQRDALWWFASLFALYLAMYIYFLKSSFKKGQVTQGYKSFVMRALANKAALLGQIYNSIKKRVIILVLY